MTDGRLIVPKYESDFHTNELSPTPWHAEDIELKDANGAMIATFEVRHTTLGLLEGAYKNCELAARAVNAYTKRSGADIRQLQQRTHEALEEGGLLQHAEEPQASWA